MKYLQARSGPPVCTECFLSMCRAAGCRGLWIPPDTMSGWASKGGTCRECHPGIQDTRKGAKGAGKGTKLILNRNRTKNGHKSFLLTSYKVHFIFKVKINDRLICGFSLPPCISRRHFKHPEEFCQKLEKKVAVGIWWMEAKNAEKHTAMPT